MAKTSYVLGQLPEKRYVESRSRFLVYKNSLGAEIGPEIRFPSILVQMRFSSILQIFYSQNFKKCQGSVMFC